ncbi:MAG: protein translocase subunit SecF [Candidatus Curtissbacteria bacterium]|nr:protein translocase subunit SecF [Candidatus Curtissbacteria bacterium]
MGKTKMNIIKHKNIFFTFSIAITLAGLIALYAWGLKLGIDFAGGTLWEIKLTEKSSLSPQEIEKTFEENGAEISSIARTSENSALVRMKATEEEKISTLKQKLNETYGKVEDVRLETVGPTVSKELTEKAIYAVAMTIGAIVIYVTWAFRKVPKPASSLAFGVSTVIALVHDVVVVIGAFSILGHFLGLEVDSLFITALLTVLGFSVHDTIVVFDRIRENLRRHSASSLEEIVNHSILQTLARSLNTSLTVVIVLSALLLFGGESIRPFIIALLIGVVTGTYSSIFIASPLLVVWNNIRSKSKR